MKGQKFFEIEFSKLFEDDKSDIKKRYDEIIKEIKNERKLLVIKIDDLDRLSNDEVLDTLKLIRIIANFPNTVYIVGYDKSYITQAIKY